MSGKDRMVDCSRAVARLTQDPLSPSPLLELAQLTLLLKQRVEALESAQRVLEERLARLAEKADPPGDVKLRA